MRWCGLALVVGLGCGGAGDPASGDTDTDAGTDTGDDAASTSSGTSPSTSSTSASTTAETSSSSTTNDPTSSEASSGSSTGDDPFALEVHTALVDGRLVLECNLPPDVESCMALDGAPCDDLDLDGLVDAWEDIVIDRLRPLRRLDEGESFVGDAEAVAGDVGRVAPGPAGDFRLFVMLGWSRDYGSCGGFTGHDGDSERVALALEPYPDGGAGGVAMASAYTAAHEGTINDHGRVYTGADLSLLVFGSDPTTGEPRWIVFPSENKHATYGTIDICEGISVVPCIDEDCGPDGVRDPSAYDLLPEFVNAGEASAPIVDDLSALGFTGDSAWAEQDFCGGTGGTNCTAPVREKLLVDPF